MFVDPYEEVEEKVSLCVRQGWVGDRGCSCFWQGLVVLVWELIRLCLPSQMKEQEEREETKAKEAQELANKVPVYQLIIYG